MSEQHEAPTTRKELMRPAQLLGLALVAALFGGFVTAMSLGLFQSRGDTAQNVATVQHSLVVGGVVAGIIFIVVLLLMSLMLLAVKPEDYQKPLDRAVLLPDDDQGTPGGTVARPAADTDDSGAAKG